MSSNIDLKINVKTDQAASEVDQLDNKVKGLKAEAERPVNVRVNVDTAGATTGAGRLREALSNVRATGLEELSQKAGQLAAQLPGVAGDIAEIAIKSAASFGPVGIAFTAVAAGLALVKQAVDEHAAAEALAAARTQELANAQTTLGQAYPSVTAAINAATTASQAHKAAMEAEMNVIQMRVAAIQAGASPEAAAREVAVIQETVRAHENLNAALVTHALHSGNSAEQQTVLGLAFRHSSDAIQESINVNDALAVLQDRNARIAADAARAANIQAVNRRKAAQEALQDAAAQENNNTAVTLATRELREAETAANAAFVTMNRTEAEANRLHTEGVAALGRLTNATKDFENAEKEAGRAAHIASVASSQAAEARRRATEAASQAAAIERRLHEEKMRQIQEESAARERAVILREDNLRRIMGMNQLQGFSSGELADREHQRSMDAAARNIQDIAEREIIDGKARDLSNRRAQMAAEEANRVNTASGIMGNAVENAGAKAAQGFGAAYAAILEGGNVGDILQAQLKAILASIGQESAVQALFETAKGFAALANPVTAATAPGHFASAGIFAATAVAAGAASAAIPAAASAPSGGGGATAASARASTPERSSASGGSEAPKNITINMNAFQSSEQAQALIVRSLREAGYNGRNQVGSSFNSSRR